MNVSLPFHVTPLSTTNPTELKIRAITKWVVQGALNVDIGANPSAESGDEDEGVGDQAVKVVDIVDTFRLQEQPSFDKKQFIAYMKRYIKLLTAKLEGEKQELFKKHIEGATKSLISKLKDLQFYVLHLFFGYILGKVLLIQLLSTLPMDGRKSSAEHMQCRPRSYLI
ncbi:hypothetical protein JHK87_057385 [Glycine soja]|nr:hypothetical protein JHK87_057385 [Glycine soja]